MAGCCPPGSWWRWRAVLQRYGGPGVAELVLEITPDVMVGKVRKMYVDVVCLNMYAAR